MAQVQELKVETRNGTGKGPAYQARLKGLIPAVVYGGTGKPENVAVDSRTLERHVDAGHFLTTLFLLDFAGQKTRVIPAVSWTWSATVRCMSISCAWTKAPPCVWKFPCISTARTSRPV